MLKSEDMFLCFLNIYHSPAIIYRSRVMVGDRQCFPKWSKSIGPHAVHLPGCCHGKHLAHETYSVMASYWNRKKISVIHHKKLCSNLRHDWQSCLNTMVSPCTKHTYWPPSNQNSVGTRLLIYWLDCHSCRRIRKTDCPGIGQGCQNRKQTFFYYPFISE